MSDKEARVLITVETAAGEIWKLPIGVRTDVHEAIELAVDMHDELEAAFTPDVRGLPNFPAGDGDES